MFAVNDLGEWRKMVVDGLMNKDEGEVLMRLKEICCVFILGKIGVISWLCKLTSKSGFG